MCEECGGELEEEIFVDEIEVQETVSDIESRLDDDVNESLVFHKISVLPGHYYGVQFYVETTDDPTEMDNEDCRYYFDMYRSVAIRRYNSEVNKVCRILRKLAKELHVIGLINIQFIVSNDEVYVIEVNPRSSRTVPYISKVTGIPIVPLATKVILGSKIRDLGYEPGLQPEADYFAIKMPVFSFEKIRGADISLGPEMKSTGECLGIAKTFDERSTRHFLAPASICRSTRT